MTLAIEETIHISARADAVWRLLSDPNSWRLWWPGCRSAEATDRKPLRDGSVVVLALQLGLAPFNLRATIEIAQPNRTLIWVGRGFGLSGRHAFYLEARPNGTFVRQRETYDGWGLIWFRLLRLDRATARMFKENLRGLRKLAERAL